MKAEGSIICANGERKKRRRREGRNLSRRAPSAILVRDQLLNAQHQHGDQQGQAVGLSTNATLLERDEVRRRRTEGREARELRAVGRRDDRAVRTSGAKALLRGVGLQDVDVARREQAESVDLLARRAVE